MVRDKDGVRLGDKGGSELGTRVGYEKVIRVPP